MDDLVRKLERVLAEQVGAHEKLLELLRGSREAMREADASKVATLAQRENGLLQRIAELEKQRLQLAADLTLKLEPGASEPRRLTELAERLPEPSRGRLLVLRQQLRERIEQVRHASAAAKRVSSSLLQHMQGLVQTINVAMTGGGTYGREGGSGFGAGRGMQTFEATA